MSEFTVFPPEEDSSQQPVTDDGDSDFESAEEDPEVIEEAELDNEALQDLREVYFDPEEMYIEDEEDDEFEVDEADEELEDDDEEDDDEEEDDEMSDDEDELEEAEALAQGLNIARGEENDDQSILINRRATLALLSSLQGRLFGTDRTIDVSPGRRRTRAPWKPTIIEEPVKAGVELANSGEFGEPSPSHSIHSARRFPYSVRTKLLAREFSANRRSKAILADHFLPTSHGRLAVQYASRAYSGQFSQDGSFFYTCSQDFRVRLYDTTDPTQWKHYKTVLGTTGRWTITDANLSPDNRFIAYSSITPVVYMARTAPNNTEEQEVLDFTGPGRMGYTNGIWSIRFSNDASEIVAGAGDRRMYVYDIESRQVVLSVRGHANDVNAVCFADQSSNVLFSGSDDCLIKVWDRRSMVNKKEAGTLPGHTEGITYISSKGDGRYVLSNGKDQTTKLWDIRKLISVEKWDRTAHVDYQTSFDYRHMQYPGHAARKHPDDRSVMTYTGHAILKTLIRCGFSPAATTDQQYIYSGSDCGKVWIWNLDGTVNRTLDLSKSAKPTHPVNPGRRRFLGFGSDGDSACIRDASWHPTLPYMASTSWHTEIREAGSIYLHEFGEGEEAEYYDTDKVLKRGIKEPDCRPNDFWI